MKHICSGLILLVCSVVMAFDDVFEDIPSFFDGVNVGVGSQYGVMVESARVIPEGDSSTYYSTPGPLVYSFNVYAALQETTGVSLFGYVISGGLGVNDGVIFDVYDDGSAALETGVAQPYFLDLSVRRGLLVNPSSLLYAQAGLGWEAYVYKVFLQDSGYEEVEGSSIYMDLAAGIEVSLLEHFGVQVGGSIRRYYDRDEVLGVLEGDPFEVESKNMAITSGFRLIYHQPGL